MAARHSPKASPMAPSREQLLDAVRAAPEPLDVRSFAKLLEAPFRLREADLTPLLDELVQSGTLHRYPPKTAKGKPRYWDRDLRELARAALLELAQQADSPLTARDFAQKLTAPLKFKEAELAPLLDECVSAGTLYSIPPATPRGKPRYWSRDLLEFCRQSILTILAAKGPLAEQSLAKALPDLSPSQFRQVLDTLLAARSISCHPPLSRKGATLLGRRPPAPATYLEDIGRQLAAVVQTLLAAGVPPEELRRALVQTVEAAGISLAGTPVPRREPVNPSQSGDPDLVELMRQLEPGADRGALVGARDLRRAAQIEKHRFDGAVLQLARQGRLSLHRHDYAMSLSPVERDELVADDRGNYYAGVALRQNEG